MPWEDVSNKGNIDEIVGALEARRVAIANMALVSDDDERVYEDIFSDHGAKTTNRMELAAARAVQAITQHPEKFPNVPEGQLLPNEHGTFLSLVQYMKNNTPNEDHISNSLRPVSDDILTNIDNLSDNGIFERALGSNAATAIAATLLDDESYRDFTVNAPGNGGVTPDVIAGLSDEEEVANLFSLGERGDDGEFTVDDNGYIILREEDTQKLVNLLGEEKFASQDGTLLDSSEQLKALGKHVQQDFHSRVFPNLALSVQLSAVEVMEKIQGAGMSNKQAKSPQFFHHYSLEYERQLASLEMEIWDKALPGKGLSGDGTEPSLANIRTIEQECADRAEHDPEYRQLGELYGEGNQDGHPPIDTDEHKEIAGRMTDGVKAIGRKGVKNRDDQQDSYDVQAVAKVDNPTIILQDAVRAAAAQAHNTGHSNTSGTTLVATYIDDEGVSVAKIGDSSTMVLYEKNDGTFGTVSLAAHHRASDPLDALHILSVSEEVKYKKNEAYINGRGASSHAIGDRNLSNGGISLEPRMAQVKFADLEDRRDEGKIYVVSHSDALDKGKDDFAKIAELYHTEGAGQSRNLARLFADYGFQRGTNDNITSVVVDATPQGENQQAVLTVVADGHGEPGAGAALSSFAVGNTIQQTQGRAIVSQAKKMKANSLQRGNEAAIALDDPQALQEIIQVLAAAKNARGGDEEQPVLHFNKADGTVFALEYSEDAGWGVQGADANRSRASSVDSVPGVDVRRDGEEFNLGDATINREGEIVMKNGGSGKNGGVIHSVLHGNDVDFSDDDVGSRTDSPTITNPLLDAAGKGVQTSQPQVDERFFRKELQDLQQLGGSEFSDDESVHSVAETKMPFANSSRTTIPLKNASQQKAAPIQPIAPPPSPAASTLTGEQRKQAGLKSQQIRTGRPTLEPRSRSAFVPENTTALGNERSISPNSSDDDGKAALFGGGTQPLSLRSDFARQQSSGLGGGDVTLRTPAATRLDESNVGTTLNPSQQPSGLGSGRQRMVVSNRDAANPRASARGNTLSNFDNALFSLVDSFNEQQKADFSDLVAVGNMPSDGNGKIRYLDGKMYLKSKVALKIASDYIGAGSSDRVLEEIHNLAAVEAGRIASLASHTVPSPVPLGGAGGTVPPVPNPVRNPGLNPGAGGTGAPAGGDGAPVVTSGPGTGASVVTPSSAAQDERAIAAYAATLKKEFEKALAKDLDRSSINPWKNASRVNDKLVTELADAVARTHAEEGLDLGDNAEKMRASKKAAANVAQYYASETGKASPQIGKLNHTQLLEGLTYAAVNGGEDAQHAQHALRESLYKSEAEAISKTSLRKGNWGLTGTRDTIAATLKETFEENNLDIIALTQDHDAKLAFRKKIRAAVDNNQGEYLAPAIKGAVESFVGEQTSAQGVTSQGNGQGTPQPSGDARGGGSRSASPNTVAPESEQEPEREQMSPHDLHKKEAELKEAKRKQDRLEEKGRPKALMTGKAAVGTLVGAVFLGLITGGIGFLVVGAIGAAVYGIDKYRKSSYEKKLNKVAVQVADKADAIKEAKQGGGKERTHEPARSEGIDSGVADKLDALQARLDAVERENAALKSAQTQPRGAHSNGRSSPTGPVDFFAEEDDYSVPSSVSAESYTHGKGSRHQPHRPYLEEEDHFVSAAHNASSRQQLHQSQHRSSTDDYSKELGGGAPRPPVSTRGNGGISQEVKNQARKATSNVEGVSEEKGGASNTHARNLDASTNRSNGGVVGV